MAKVSNHRDGPAKDSAQFRNPACLRTWLAIAAIVVTILYGLGLVFSA